MRIVQFDPTTALGKNSLMDSINLKTSSGETRGVFVNQSACNLILTFANGYLAYLDAGAKRLFNIDLPNGLLTWQIQSSIGGTFGEQSQVTVEIYDQNETIVESYPCAISVSGAKPTQGGSTITWTGTTQPNPSLSVSVPPSIAYLDGFTLTITPPQAIVSHVLEIDISLNDGSPLVFYYGISVDMPTLIDTVMFPGGGLPAQDSHFIISAQVIDSIGIGNGQASMTFFGHYSNNQQ